MEPDGLLLLLVAQRQHLHRLHRRHRGVGFVSKREERDLDDDGDGARDCSKFIFQQLAILFQPGFSPLHGRRVRPYNAPKAISVIGLQEMG
jgi:hypothetical protein